MTANEYNARNMRLKNDLIAEAAENPPQTQTEKDLFNLKDILYGIGHGSRYFRWGYVSTLKRAIKRLEEQGLEEKEKQKEKI